MNRARIDTTLLLVCATLDDARMTNVRSGSCARISHSSSRTAPAASFLRSVCPWLTTACPGDLVGSHFLQDEFSCTFGLVLDGATLVGFTGDDVCLPAGDAA